MVGKACSAVLLLVLGFVWVEVRGKRDVCAAAQLGLPAEVPRSLSCLPAQDRARTLIANHIAHLDILVMMALDLPAFVAKVRKVVLFVAVRVMSPCTLSCCPARLQRRTFRWSATLHLLWAASL